MRLELLVHRFIQTDKHLLLAVSGLPAGHPSIRDGVNSAPKLRLRGTDERRK
jgi:hypothetical protein